MYFARSVLAQAIVEQLLEGSSLKGKIQVVSASIGFAANGGHDRRVQQVSHMMGFQHTRECTDTWPKSVRKLFCEHLVKL